MNEILITALIVATSSWMWTLRGLRREKALRMDDNDANRRSTERLETRLYDVEAREARFRQAIGYYADRAMWLASDGAHSPAFRDRGKIAREALR